MTGPGDGSFAALLRRHRLAAGLTQEALAERAGLSGEAIQKLERGTSHPQRETLARLLAALHLPAEEERTLRDAALAPRRPRADQPAKSLPAPLTRFIGRQHELSALAALLATKRLLTLTGVGGCGKTRLALELARQTEARFGDGVCFVPLASLTDPALLPAAVATALDVREARGHSLPDTLARALQAKRLLLLLDNAEHLLDACAHLAETLLQRCPHLQLLVTSREPLGIAGEVVRQVPPLGLPAVGTTLPDQVAGSEAVQLFLDRAQAVRPAFALTNQNAATVAELCRQLDGLPLTLVLAAAWLRALSVELLAERLGDRFRLLTGGSRTALPRQQTLQATLDWSYDLLNERERRLFRRLSVFAGGWSLEAAETLCSGDGIDRAEVLDLLRQLVEQSLVLLEEQPDGRVRYRLLETLRQYAWGKLEAGGEAETLAERHAEYFLGHAEQAVQQAGAMLGISTRQPGRLMATMASDRDNLHAALQWLEAQPDVERALRLARPLAHYWYARGLAGEGNARLQRLFAKATASTSPDALARTRFYLASFARVHGDYATARTHYQDVEAQARRSGDRTLLALALNDLGLVFREEGALARARSCVEESVALWRTLGFEHEAATAVDRLGSIAHVEGNLPEARRCFEQFYAYARGHGYPLEMGWALHELALLALDQGSVEAARSPLHDGMEAFRQLNYALGMVWTLPLFVCQAAMEGHGERAVRLAGALDAITTQTGLYLYQRQRRLLDRWVPAARLEFSDQQAAAVWAEGQEMTLDEAVAYSLEDGG